MPKGNLVVRLSDMTGALAKDRVKLEFRPVQGSPGAGGELMEVSINGPVGELTITGIHCQTGFGTLYEVRAETPHYRRYAFLQNILEKKTNKASDDVEFWVKPGDVKDIKAPAFDTLPKVVRDMCINATMIRDKEEDKDLLNLTGSALYKALGPMRKACLLNIVTKAGDKKTAAACLSEFRGLMISRQDRCFAFVTTELVGLLNNSSLFTSANNALHDPPPGFEKSTLGSFKSRDPHANLQVTFLREVQTNRLAADIDIDESSGIKHGFEVIKNAVLSHRTNPYLIREFLNAADFEGHSLSPDYQFVF
jgi:hypothetical protein